MPIKEGNSVIFYLNLRGFPLDSAGWQQLWSYAQELQPKALDELRDIRDRAARLEDVDVPQAPFAQLNSRRIGADDKVARIQRYIDELKYNHTGFQFFEVHKDKSLFYFAQLAKSMIQESLPIKCLEAVILAIYLLNEIPLVYAPSTSSSNSNNNNNKESDDTVVDTSSIVKFTIGFKTVSKGNVHRHVVLGVYNRASGLFGAIGLSRRADLAYKPLVHPALSQLIDDYVESYANYLHRIKRVKIGMPIARSNRSFETIGWDGVSVSLSGATSELCSKNDWQKAVDKHARVIRLFEDPLPTTSPSFKSGYGTMAALPLRHASNLSKTKASSCISISKLGGGGGGGSGVGASLRQRLEQQTYVIKQKFGFKSGRVHVVSNGAGKKNANNEVDNEDYDDAEDSVIKSMKNIDTSEASGARGSQLAFQMLLAPIEGAQQLHSPSPALPVKSYRANHFAAVSHKAKSLRV